jgi:hypothetical protein
MSHRSLSELTAALERVRTAPRDDGKVLFIVRRPAKETREILDEAELDPAHGMVGDFWIHKPSKRTPDGSPNPEQMLTLMNIRAIEALAERDRWPLAGDQLYVDFDLSETSLPPGTQLLIGSAVVVISATPHTGCAKFTERFGSDATKWVNSDEGRTLRLRGVNARVVQRGVVRLGDTLRRA